MTNGCQTSTGAASVAPDLPLNAPTPPAATRSMIAGMGLVALAGCILASQDAAIKEMTARQSPIQISFVRYCWHAVFVAIFLWATGRRRIYRTARLPLHVTRAVLLLTASTAMFIAIAFVPLSQATVIQFLSPLVVTLLSVVFLGERIGWRRITALALGFAGVLVVIGPQLGAEAGFSAIWLLPLLSAFAAAGYVLMTRRLSEPAETVPAMALMPVICVLVLLPVQPFFWSPISAMDFAVLTLLGFTGTLAHVAIQLGMQAAPASILSPFLYSQVIFASLLGIVFFREPMSIGFVLGTFLIVGAGLAIWWIERPPATSSTRKVAQ
ncbi:DMT family transporter [Marinovum sp. 2_MG-2023]|uniref:DMT family transporter n=1 Tax=unclassified Marinovum TaxID=2647166 RepID=UPI0026E23DA6|nr:MULTISPECIES: DMT family transporter [unclassified Marinovum]MDO6732973.1 DMT family transporter [Marinovum sp. 2_MG-2023]MDO6782230.1 DMT family transporter [Marinovum sp. 1_MG-2023]